MSRKGLEYSDLEPIEANVGEGASPTWILPCKDHTLQHLPQRPHRDLAAPRAR